MIKNIINILILNILLSVNLYSQNKTDNFDFIKLKKGPDLTFDELLNFKLSELFQLQDAFLYNEELKSGNYFVEKNDKEIVVYFGNTSNIGEEKVKKINKNKFAAFIKTNVEVNGAYYNSLQLKNENMLIDFDKAVNNIKKFNGMLNMDNTSFPEVNYIWKQKMLMDQEICNYGENYNFGKILNRSVTKARLLTPNNQPCQLFANETDGDIITFLWSSGITTKVFCVDELWNRVIWFDENLQNPFAHSFGNSGSGYEQFRNPSGIAICGPYEYYIGSDHNYDYPIYVADYSNNRIIKFIYNVNNPQPNVWGWRILAGSFSTIRYCNAHPYDVEIHKGVNSGTDITAQNDDILWITQKYVSGSDLIAINALTGNIICIVDHFVYQGRTYSLHPDRMSIYRSANGANNILAVIDNVLNSVIFFKLNNDGTLSSNTTLATSVWKFYDWDVPTSVKLVSTNPALGLTALVSHVYPSGDSKGHVNIFKVNMINGYPIAEYLSSHSYFYNSSSELKSIHNLGIQNGFVDIFTLESWDENYGIRRYKHGIDIISESANPFCTDIGYMVLTLRTTNPCRIDFSAKYCNGANCTWEDRNIEWINGVIYNGSAGYLPSGTNTLRIKVNNIGTMDDPPAGLKRLRLTVRMAPQDEELYTGNQHQITRVYEVDVKTCNTGGGGCPYLYVFDGDSLRQDNNILHRSEFPENVGYDITDVYKLRVNPKFDEDNNTCTMQIRELNNDYSYFDKLQLKAIDHPIGTMLGVTENRDIVLYFPKAVISPDSAFLNDTNVTCDLQYDSSCTNSVSGDSSDVITTTEEGDGIATKFFTKFNNILENLLVEVGILKKVNPGISVKNMQTRDEFNYIIDSIAVITDPQENSDAPYPIINAQKDYAGQITGCSTESDFCSEPIPFARRENRSEVIVPVGKDLFIDSVYTDWYRSFEISYLCTTPVYYGGYLERELDLTGALHSSYGDVIETLRENDDYYAEMDTLNTLTLTFSNTNVSVPEGWTRDYVLITDGQYVSSEGDKLSFKNPVNNNLPRVFELHQNYPNPFNPISKIKFDLPKDVQVTIKVYDILGREVKSLVNDFRKAGYHEITFDGTNYASGVYFYRLEAGDFVKSKKMVLIK